MAMSGRYQIPASVRYHALLGAAFVCLLTAVVLLGTRYGLFVKQYGPMPVWRAALVWGPFALFVLALQVRWWLTKAPRCVNVVEWNDLGVVLHPARGHALTLAWSDITRAEVPPDPGPLTRGYYGGMSYSAKLFAAGRELPYAVPLSWSPDCEAFLEALEKKTRGAREDPSRRRR